MSKTLCVILAVFGTSGLVMADFTDDFQAALKLYNEGKNTEACESFTGIAKSAPNTSSKADSLYYAAMSAGKIKEFKKAEELIAQIPRESTKKLCRMNLMLAQNKPLAVIDTFKDEDLTTWSDFHIFDALMTRGWAYRLLKQYAEALKDFKKAEEFALTPDKKAQILNLTGGTWQEAGDDEQALAAWRRMEDIPYMKGRGIINDAIFNAARILTKQQKYDEALKEIGKIEVSATGHTRPLMVMAEIYTAQGKKAEAIAKYNEALKGAPENMKPNIQSAIEKLNVK